MVRGGPSALRSARRMPASEKLANFIGRRGRYGGKNRIFRGKRLLNKAGTSKSEGESKIRLILAEMHIWFSNRVSFVKHAFDEPVNDVHISFCGGMGTILDGWLP